MTNFVSAFLKPGGFFDLPGKTAELKELEEQASAPDLWNDQAKAKSLTQRLSRVQLAISTVTQLESRLDDADLMIELAGEGEAGAMEAAVEELTEAEEALFKLEDEALYFGDYDEAPAILSVHAGAGGVDAQDWAEILLRMYRRFLEDEGFGVTLDEITEGEEAGIKSATMTVSGDRAYATLESERGVHRLVRISPFDSNSRRHTSFAGVDVVPEVEDVEIEVGDDDLRVDTYRSQGAGGQHVNTTDSAVRLTHLPTGLVVAVQNERSQLQNRNRAMAILKARLADFVRQQQQEELDAIRGKQGEAAWGNQIRSYVMQPYQMVKDLRTGEEVGNVQGVLDGSLGPFVEAYLRWRRAKHERSSPAE